MNKIMSLRQFSSKKINEDESAEEMIVVDTALLDELVELVGSEEEVEQAAIAAHAELEDAFNNEDLELSEEDIPENLAVASLVLKLVELGSLDPRDADELIAKYIG